MAVFWVLMHIVLWALVFLVVGALSPFIFQLVVPNYKIGNLDPLAFGFIGIIVGAVFGLVLGIVLEMRRRHSISGGTTTGGSGPTTDDKYLRYWWVSPADAQLNSNPKIALRNGLIWLAIFFIIIVAYGLLN